MDPFWSSVFGYFKDRHVGAVFIRTLLVLAVLAVAGVFLYPLRIFLLPVAGVIFLAWMVRSISRARARWRDRYKSSPLSRDELKKARSKLMRAKN